MKYLSRIKNRLFVLGVSFSLMMLPTSVFGADCSSAGNLVLNVPDPSGDPATTGISASGGVPPYKWSAYGAGFSLQYQQTEDGNNKLITSGIGCRCGTVKVIDSCGKQAEKYPRGNGSWVQVQNYNGECVLTGTASENCASGGMAITRGKYKLTETLLSYAVYGTANTTTYCDNCSASPPAPQERESCFDGWENSCGQCTKNWKGDDLCVIHPHYCTIMTYLGTYCTRHVKALYEWKCLNDPNYDETCGADECPNDPNKTEPGKCGCGYADIKSIRPEKDNLIPGETTRVQAETENPAGGAVTWSIWRADQDSTASATITPSEDGNSATISDVSGQGYMKIGASVGACAEVVEIYVGCKACEGNSGGQCDNAAGSGDGTL